MDYIIQQVMVGQILVRFEDGSRAMIPIQPTDTPEQIDHAVSFYDPDFAEENQEEINQFVSVGERRFSNRLDDENGEEVPDPNLPTEEEVENDPVKDAVKLIPLDDAMMLYFAQKYSEQGDDRVSNALDNLMATYYVDIDPETILGFIERKTTEVTNMQEQMALDLQALESEEDIFDLALQELGEEAE